MTLTLLLSLFFLIAFVYSTVGHGGASGYLALMVLVGFTADAIRPTALLLNVMVSALATLFFYRQGFFRMKVFLPLIFLSIPCAFIGATIHLPVTAFKILLGICLLISALRLLKFPGAETPDRNKKLPLTAALLIGGVVGLISGMVGIGGGILLSPLLILFRWANVKESAALAAPFILLNSLAGLLGLAGHGLSFPPQIAGWMLAACLGGIAGSYWGSGKFNTVTLRYLLVVVLLMATGKLLIV